MVALRVQSADDGSHNARVRCWAAMARVLLTGADGYIGVRLGDHLLRAGFDVVGLDSGFHRVGLAVPERRPAPGDAHQGHPRARARTISRDTTRSSTSARSRTTPSAHSTSASPTASTTRARSALRSSQSRRASSASCRCPRAASTESPPIGPSTETDPVEPLTAYARCKVLVEEAVGAARGRHVLSGLPPQRHRIRCVAQAALRPRRQRPRGDGVPLQGDPDDE